ncbi:MAG TPA: Nif3-like dinuclear metal center hexameric protein [Pirellulaceae bacterium]|nr:Nif3-like dinuclear metal center hexameric protein [Pirellulaceae bacterium]
MTTVHDLCVYLEQFAPSRLAEEWDNVGLLVGDRTREVQRIMTCLTITPASAAEAIAQNADLIVTHHPLPFRPLKRLTTDSVPGRLLLSLIGAQIAVHSPHTAFDSAATGINERLAQGLGLTNIAPLVPRVGDPDALGSGRYGQLVEATPLSKVASQVSRFLRVPGVQQVGDDTRMIRSVAVACGSAGSFLDPARRAGCDLLVTGETTFHTCLEAEAEEVALLLPGHFASERFAVEELAKVLEQAFPSLTLWASRSEVDPLRWVPVS